MNYFLVLVIAGLAIMVVVSLVRGIVAFLQSSRMAIDAGGDGAGEGPSAMQLKQSQMMFARIKYQALAVVVVGVLLAINK